MLASGVRGECLACDALLLYCEQEGVRVSCCSLRLCECHQCMCYSILSTVAIMQRLCAGLAPW
jgi:hypothetical protein